MDYFHGNDSWTVVERVSGIYSLLYFSTYGPRFDILMTTIYQICQWCLKIFNWTYNADDTDDNVDLLNQEPNRN